MDNCYQIFQDKNGKEIVNNEDNTTLEDATIEGTTIAENNGWELLIVDIGTITKLDKNQRWYAGENYHKEL